MAMFLRRASTFSTRSTYSSYVRYARAFQTTPRLRKDAADEDDAEYLPYVDLDTWKPRNIYGPTVPVVDSLFRTAYSNGTIETVREELLEVAEECKEEDFFHILQNEDIDEALGVSPELRIVLEELVANGRSKQIPKLAADFDTVCRDAFNEMHVKVIVAQPINDEEREDIEYELTDAYLSEGGELFLTVEVDPEIVGGRIYVFENHIMDLSVKQIVDEWYNMKMEVLNKEYDETIGLLDKHVALPTGSTSNRKFKAALADREQKLLQHLGYTN